jgi:hypothetical protein
MHAAFVLLAILSFGACSGAPSSSDSASPSPPVTGSGLASTDAGASEDSDGASAEAAGAGDCVVGGTVTEINDKTARVFCGPATAVVTVGGSAFKDGACEFSDDMVTVNLGTLVPGELTGPDYFGLTAFGIDTLPLTEMPAITSIKDGVSGCLGGGEIPGLAIARTARRSSSAARSPARAPGTA